MFKKELKKWIKWLENEFIPDYHTQVEYAQIGTGISLTELNEFEEFLAKLKKHLEGK